MLCADIAGRIILMSKLRYSELIKLETFIERYRYLKLSGVIGSQTFGYDRYLNQLLYKSPEWKSLRRDLIVRDGGCDLGMLGYDIYGMIVLHHINPITVEDIIQGTSKLLDPENLIITTHNTHMAIHYGNEDLLNVEPIERSPGDTNLWARGTRSD